jgi:hypothetical protein
LLCLKLTDGLMLLRIVSGVENRISYMVLNLQGDWKGLYSGTGVTRMFTIYISKLIEFKIMRYLAWFTHRGCLNDVEDFFLK